MAQRKRKPLVLDFPSGKYAQRFRLPDGRLVDFSLNWDYCQGIARGAWGNKTLRSNMGPVSLKAVPA